MNAMADQSTLLAAPVQQQAPAAGAGLLQVAKSTGWPALKIMKDFASLAYGPGKITFADYLRLRLYDLSFWQGDRREIVGDRRAVFLWHEVNWRQDWWAVLEDKVAASSYLAAHGLPVLQPLALWCPGNGHAGANLLRSAAELRTFLDRADVYPLFGKPVDGIQSLGAMALRSRQGDLLETFDGTWLPVDQFVAELTAHFSGGYIFQRFVTPHAEVAQLSRDRLSTVRFVTLRGADGPRIVAACAKLITGENVADNFWRAGNLLATVDVESGELKGAISGVGAELRIVEEHPDSGATLVGSRWPLWQEMRELALEGAKLMRHVPLIGWDIAATNEGARIVEMNVTPDFTLPQLANRRGMLDANFAEVRAFQMREAKARKAEVRRTMPK